MKMTRYQLGMLYLAMVVCFMMGATVAVGTVKWLDTPAPVSTDLLDHAIGQLRSCIKALEAS